MTARTPQPTGAPPSSDAAPAPHRSYPCSACGGQLRYYPAQSKLRCESCGHAEEIATASAEAAPSEYDLENALSSARPARGWGTERRSVACTSCGARVDLSPTTEATSCAFCGSPQVAPEAPAQDVFTPETLIPFRVDRGAALESFRAWVGKGWFRPAALKHNWRMEKIAGVYLPFWTFDADTRSSWDALAGHHYFEERKNSRGQVTRERKTRWERASGTYERSFNDLPVLASGGLERSMVESVEPFDMNALTPYRPEYLTGWDAERYSTGLEEGWAIGKDRMERIIRDCCAARVPGDEHENLTVDTAWSGLKFKHVLLPLWVASYRFRGKPYRFLVNGESGKVHGEAPVDALKVGLAVAALTAAIILFVRLVTGMTGVHMTGWWPVIALILLIPLVGASTIIYLLQTKRIK